MTELHDHSWMTRADRACRTHPALADLTSAERTALFYPERGGSTRLPRAICAECPVGEECREWALRHEQHGFWNSSERQRRLLRRTRGISLKSPAAIAEEAACGTQAGFARHHRAGELPCPRCLDAYARAVEYRRPSRSKAAS